MAPLSVLEEKVITGEWWRPDYPEHRVEGTLTFSAEEFVLRLSRSLLPAPELPDGGHIASFFNRVEEEVIWGDVDGGGAVSLLDVVGHQFIIPGARGAEPWRPSAAATGAHVRADFGIECVDVRTEHFDEWAGTPHVAHQLEWDPEGTTERFSASAERALLDEGPVDGLGVVQIIAKPRFHWDAREAQLSMSGAFRIVPTNPVTWRGAFDHANSLRSFLRLAAGQPTALESVHLRAADRSERGQPVWVELLRRTSAMLVKRPATVDYFNMRFRRADLSSDIGSVLSLWLDTVERHRRAWKLLTSADDHRLVDADSRFTTMARVIEGLHATDFGSPTMAIAERDQRVQRAIESLPADLTDWATPLLEASSPPVFRHRVLEMLGAVGKLGEDLAGGDVDGFAGYVTRTRNAQIHPTSRDTKGVFADDDVVWAGKALEYLAHAYLLMKIGREVTEISERSRRSGLYEFVLEEARAFFAADTARVATEGL